ncbi:MAG: hypothetical protein CL610_22060 [Anaerolineaceae bacterium]|nr:hypothetical protein [Anaerolineaceae bacterium]
MTDQIHPHPPITDDPARHETIVAEGVSFDDFLTQYAEVHAEWLIGRVILIGSKSTQHQLILGVLSNLVSYFLRFKNLGLILSAGVPMFIDNDLPALDAQGYLTSGVLAGFALDPTLLWQEKLPAGPALVELVQQMMGDAI